MSLYRQLWIAVVVVMLCVFGVTFAINGVSSSRYLSEQLAIKNSDDASSMALSLSQQDLDPVSLEIQLSTLLDHGSFELVEFRQADGTLTFSRNQEIKPAKAPAWFTALFNIQSTAATAGVSNGWVQLGALTLRSGATFAYDELWTSAQRSMIALILATVLAGGLGSLLLRIILSPLQKVVGQADALGERRFITVEEPRTREFQQLARAMNTLTERIRDILERESGRLSDQRANTDLDTLSGVYTRDAFLSRLNALIASDNASAQGSLAIVRLSELPAVNAQFGRDVTDQLISAIGTELASLKAPPPSQGLPTITGRLTGSDFAIIVPEDNDARKIANTLCDALKLVVQRFDLRSDVAVTGAYTGYEASDSGSAILNDTELALNRSVGHPDSRVALATKGTANVSARRDDSEYWDALLKDALNKQLFALKLFPVNDAQDRRWQTACMLYLEDAKEILSAGMLMPWVNRLRLNAALDRAVVELALAQAAHVDGRLCINISIDGLTDETFGPWLKTTLSSNPQSAGRLSIDFTESATYAHATAFRAIQQIVHAHGAEIGIKHMGHQLDKMGALADLGANYFKVDPLFINGIDKNEGSKTLLRAYAAIAQSLGAGCVAEGVSNDEEKSAAFACGATAVTGPGV